jgi:hypothetical protein
VPQHTPDPRKRRTRQHVIADQSINHVERFIIDEGHTAQRLTTDYGYDLVMMTFDDQGYAEPGLVFFQLKASESLVRSGENCAFDLDVRDYNLRKVERFPVILVLFDATERRAYWVHVQDYFAGSPPRRPKKRAKTIRVLVPRRQVVNRRAVARWRIAKGAVAVRLG